MAEIPGRDRPLRLAQVAGFPVLPARAGGKIRIVQLARAFCALGVEVTVLAPYHRTQTRELARKEPFRLVEVPYPFVIPYLFTDAPFPYGALVSFHPGYCQLLPRPLPSFDVCQLEHPAFADVAGVMPASTPVVYNSQNVEFDYVCAESRPGVVRRLAGSRMRTLEGSLVRRADHVFACSEADRSRFRELYGLDGARASILPNGIDLEVVDARMSQHRGAGGRAPEKASLPRRAIFSGSAVAHNHRAVDALLARVAPQLTSEVEFVVLGECARRFRRNPLPNLTLDPEGDVAAYASAGAVGVNPVTQGSGTSLKILDYLAHGLPVVTTPFGLRGFEELAPWVRIAELDGFAQTLRADLAPPAGVREQIEAYGWRAIASRALAVYEALATQSGANGAAA